ncbi:MAG: hypothetical protein JWM27_895 [Gemmatimonadetes bacterium]|nr:hypothetical protein [Gemmatimonadota bacterium]
MGREAKRLKRVIDPAGGGWEASEAYAWEPMRQAAPTCFVVFRGGGHELRAYGSGPLAALHDAELSALLAGLLPAATASPVLRGPWPASRRTRGAGAGLHLRGATAGV